MAPSGNEFGNARLMTAIGQQRSEPLQKSVSNLLGEIIRWQESKIPHDDISILAVEVSVASDLGKPV